MQGGLLQALPSLAQAAGLTNNTMDVLYTGLNQKTDSRKMDTMFVQDERLKIANKRFRIEPWKKARGVTK